MQQKLLLQHVLLSPSFHGTSFSRLWVYIWNQLGELWESGFFSFPLMKFRVSRSSSHCGLLKTWFLTQHRAIISTQFVLFLSWGSKFGLNDRRLTSDGKKKKNKQFSAHRGSLPPWGQFVDNYRPIKPTKSTQMNALHSFIQSSLHITPFSHFSNSFVASNLRLYFLARFSGTCLLCRG